MAGPTVEAIIKARDEATPAIEALLAHTKQANASFAKMHDDTSRQAVASMREMQGRVSTITDAMTVKFRSFAADASLALGGFAVAGVKAAMHVGEEMERTSRRMLAYTDVTKAQLKTLREMADVDFSGVKGGPTGFFEGARASMMSGVRPENADLAAKYGAIFADETNSDNATATEKLIQHTSMMGHLKNEAGQVIGFAEASREQTKAALEETLNQLIAINKVAPGNAEQIYEGFKFAGPAIRGFHREAIEGAALYTGFAEAGLGGAEGGNAIRSGYSRLAMATAKARQAIATAGLDYGDYTTINVDAMSGDDIKKGLAQRVGTLNAKTSQGVDKALAAFRQSHDLNAFNETLTNVLLGSGVKQMRDRVVAGNLAQQTTGIFAETVDLIKFLQDAKAKGLGTGFLNTVFGKEMGSRFSALDADEVARLVDRYKVESVKDNVGAAQRETAESYDGAKRAMVGQFTGMLDSLFQPMEGRLVEGMHAITAIEHGIATAPEAVRSWGAEMTGAFAAVKTVDFVGKLATFGSEIGKLAGPAEGAAAALGRLGSVLGFFGRFTPVGEAITAMDIGRNVAMPILSTIGQAARGDFYTPADEEAAADLRRQRDVMASEIRAMRERQFDPADHAPGVMEARQAIGHALADSPNAPDTDEVRIARVERARITADPNYGDAGLAQMRSAYAEMEATHKTLMDSGAKIPGSLVHDMSDASKAIGKRMEENAGRWADQIEAASRKLYDALGRAAAMPNERASLAPLRKDLEAAQAKAREGYTAPFDPVMQQKEDALHDLDNRLQAYRLKMERMPTIGANGFLEHGADVRGRRVDVGLGFDRLPVQPLRVGPVEDPRPGFGGLGVQRVELGPQKPVDVKVTGQAEVVQHLEVQVQPTPYFTGLVKRVENVAKMSLGQGDDLAGSNAAKKPSAPAVWHGPH